MRLWQALTTYHPPGQSCLHLPDSESNTNVKILHVQLRVHALKVLSCHEDTLAEEVLMDGLAVGLWDEHDRGAALVVKGVDQISRDSVVELVYGG